MTTGLLYDIRQMDLNKGNSTLHKVQAWCSTFAHTAGDTTWPRLVLLADGHLVDGFVAAAAATIFYLSQSSNFQASRCQHRSACLPTLKTCILQLSPLYAC